MDSNTKTHPQAVERPALHSGDLFGSLPLRDALAASFYPTINENGAGTIAQAAKELGIEVKEYDCDKHWPILVSRLCYAQADAFLAARALPNL